MKAINIVLTVMFVCLAVFFLLKKQDPPVIVIQSSLTMKTNGQHVLSTMTVEGCDPTTLVAALKQEGIDASTEDKKVQSGSVILSMGTNDTSPTISVAGSPPFREMRINSIGEVMIERHPSSTLDDNVLQKIGKILFASIQKK